MVATHQLHLPLVRSGLCRLPCQERELIENGSFETSAFDPWQAVGHPLIRDDEAHAFESAHYAWLGTRSGGHDEVYQTVVVPEPLCTATLIYAWNVATLDMCDEHSPKDRFMVSIRDAEGLTLQVLDNLSECDAVGFWQQNGFDLSGYAGKTIQVHFQADTDGQRISNLFVDDVHLDVCVYE